MTQNKPIRYVKKTFKRVIDTSLEKYDNTITRNQYSIFYKGHLDILTEIKDKVSLATAWLGKMTNRVDISKASMGYSDCYIHNTDIQEHNKDLRRKELNSNK